MVKFVIAGSLFFIAFGFVGVFAVGLAVYAMRGLLLFLALLWIIKAIASMTQRPPALFRKGDPVTTSDGRDGWIADSYAVEGEREYVVVFDQIPGHVVFTAQGLAPRRLSA